MRIRLLVFLLAASAALPAQNPASRQPSSPDTLPPAAQASSTAARSAKTQNRASSYYHYTLARLYEELVAIYGRSEFANKAIEEYRLAIENDPHSETLAAGLAELYAKTGRIRDAVTEAQEILKRDPDNIEARKLLGRIYLRSLGDMQAGTQSQEMLRRAIEQFEQIARLEPKNVETHLLLGRLYRLNNELPKAEQAFQTAIEIQPDLEEAVINLAYLYGEGGDSNRAIATLNSMPPEARSAKVYGALGYTYEQRREYKKAVEAYKKALALDSDNLDSIRGLAQNLEYDGQTEAALEQYRVIAEADPNDASTLLRIADIHRRAGRFDQALAALKKAEAIVRDSLDVPFNMARVYKAQGRFDEAIQLLQQILARTERADGSYSPADRNNRAVFLEMLGSVYRDTHRYDLALASFRKMLDMGDENASRAYQLIIDTHRDARQWPEATAVAREAAQKFPEDKMLKMMLAGQLADSGQADAAVAEVRGMLKGTPDDREIYVQLTNIYSRLRRWKDAEESLAEADKLATRPEEKQYLDFLRASIYERQKKYDRAEEVFRQLLAADPDNPMVLNYLGYMLADRNEKLEEAHRMIRRAVDLDPQNGAYLDSLGWVYFRMGKHEAAEQYLRKALDRSPQDGTLHDHIAELYAHTGRLKLAVTHWERALAEWNRSVPAEVETADVARVQKKLESAKVRLARQRNSE